MGTPHDDLTVFHEEDLIHALHADQMMRHPDQGPVLQAGEYGGQQFPLRFGIQPDRRLIQNDNGRFCEDSGQSHALALSSGETRPASCIRVRRPSGREATNGSSRAKATASRISLRGIRLSEPDVASVVSNKCGLWFNTEITEDISSPNRTESTPSKVRSPLRVPAHPESARRVDLPAPERPIMATFAPEEYPGIHPLT